MSFTQHFAAISQVFSHFMHICSFQQCQYCEIGNVSMGFSKSLMPKILYKSLVFDSWFDKIFGIRDLENPILTFPPHSIVSLPAVLWHKSHIIKQITQILVCNEYQRNVWWLPDNSLMTAWRLSVSYTRGTSMYYVITYRGGGRLSVKDNYNNDKKMMKITGFEAARNCMQPKNIDSRKRVFS